MARDLADIQLDALLARGEALAQLMAHPAWPAWESLIAEMRRAVLEDMARESSMDAVRFAQGVVATLDEVIRRTHIVVEHAAAALEAEESDKKVIRPEIRAAIGLGADHDGEV
jgi:hypothetical protein